MNKKIQAKKKNWVNKNLKDIFNYHSQTALTEARNIRS